METIVNLAIRECAWDIMAKTGVTYDQAIKAILDNLTVNNNNKD